MPTSRITCPRKGDTPVLAGGYPSPDQGDTPVLAGGYPVVLRGYPSPHQDSSTLPWPVLGKPQPGLWYPSEGTWDHRLGVPPGRDMGPETRKGTGKLDWSILPGCEQAEIITLPHPLDADSNKSPISIRPQYKKYHVAQKNKKLSTPVWSFYRVHSNFP